MQVFHSLLEDPHAPIKDDVDGRRITDLRCKARTAYTQPIHQAINGKPSSVGRASSPSKTNHFRPRHPEKRDNETRPTSARTSILYQWESFSQPEPSSE
jgi:hypothetical protein